MKLDSPFYFFCYLLLQNRHSWSLLDPAARDSVRQDNYFLNNQRGDYKDPSLYGKGRFADGDDNWDSTLDRKFRHRGRFLAAVLEKYRPKRVLEIGPGAGFDSRLLAEAPGTQFYGAVDIVEPFIEHLRPRLEALKQRRAGFDYGLYCEDFNRLSLDGQFDAVFVLSAVHHIPDRVELFTKLSSYVRPGGIIVCYEPTHYVRRILQLSRDFFTKGYFKRDHFTRQGNISTHHFCTYGEFRSICRKTGTLSLDYSEHDTPKKLRSLNLSGSALDPFWLSREIGVVLKKS